MTQEKNEKNGKTKTMLSIIGIILVICSGAVALMSSFFFTDVEAQTHIGEFNTHVVVDKSRDFQNSRDITKLNTSYEKKVEKIDTVLDNIRINQIKLMVRFNVKHEPLPKPLLSEDIE